MILEQYPYTIEFDNVLCPVGTSLVSFLKGFSNGTNTICGLPSVADVHLLAYKCTLDTGKLSHFDPNIFDEYPGITGVVQAITKHPIVVSYDAAVTQESKE
jgi:hypothetical protein